MNIYLKYGVSAAALLAAVSLAHAQSNEHPGAPASEHREGEVNKPAPGKPANANPSNQKQGRPAEHEKAATPPKGRAAEETHPQGQKQPEKGQPAGQPERKAATDGGRNQPAGRAENGRSRTHVSVNVTAEQKTHLHDVIIHDNAIRHYRRSDINFSLNIGTIIPETVVFYDPPPQFVEIDPELQGYKIIVLDDELLVVDPETREIVGVIELA
jgi:Protein of unknown function (DUF1236)